MFENIEQMEKEVLEFRQNILASKELVSNIERMIKLIKDQNISFEQKTENFEQTIAANIDALEKTKSLLVDEFNTEKNGLVASIQTEINVLKDGVVRLEDLVSDLKLSYGEKTREVISSNESLKNAVNNILSETVCELNKKIEGLQSSTEEKICALEEKISLSDTEIENSIQNTVNRIEQSEKNMIAALDKLNIPARLETIQKQQNSLGSKINMAMIFSVLALIASVINIFI